jgi:uracil-DNA glycosylase
MYHPADPRTALGPAAAASAVPSPVSYPADYIVFGQCPPAQEDDGGRHWYARGQNFVVGYSDCDGSVTCAFTAWTSPSKKAGSGGSFAVPP